MKLLNDVVHSIINISRSQQLFEFITLNARRAVANLYLLLVIFLVYDEKNRVAAAEVQKQRGVSFYGLCDFTDVEKLARIMKFYSAAVCFAGILARKLVIIRKIYLEFRI